MKRLAGIALAAGCLLAARQLRAQELPVYVPIRAEDSDFALKAHDAARKLLSSEPAAFSMQWLREEMDPLLRARRLLRQAMQTRAGEQAAALAKPGFPTTRDLNKEIGAWRMSIGNTAVSNWSPYADRALDARALRFPMRRDSKADKRTEPQKALDRMRQQKR